MVVWRRPVRRGLLLAETLILGERAPSHGHAFGRGPHDAGRGLSTPLPAPAAQKLAHALVLSVATQLLRCGRVFTRLLREMVACGIGVGLIPEILGRDYVQTGKLKRIVTEWEPHLPLNAYIVSRTSLPRATRAMLKHLADAIRKSQDA